MDIFSRRICLDEGAATPALTFFPVNRLACIRILVQPLGIFGPHISPVSSRRNFILYWQEKVLYSCLLKAIFAGFALLQQRSPSTAIALDRLVLAISALFGHPPQIRVHRISILCNAPQSHLPIDSQEKYDQIHRDQARSRRQQEWLGTLLQSRTLRPHASSPPRSILRPPFQGTPTIAAGTDARPGGIGS